MNIGNNIDVEIRKTWYNKTIVQEDGITHIVDPKQYIAYQFGMAKNYFLEDKKEVVKEVIKDLRIAANQLENALENEKDLERE